MKNLDEQMKKWSSRLKTEVKIKEEFSKKLATTISAEVRFLPKAAKKEITSSSPVAIKNRYEELLAFQSWMDTAGKHANNPAVVRAQVITQNYICFVYLNESCFNVLRKRVPNGGTTKKCCNFLINNPIRLSGMQ